MNEEKLKVPPKDRSEWRDIVQGKIDFKFKNLLLQVKMFHFSVDIQYQTITVEEAVDEFHKLCEKYHVSAHNDLKTIFKDW